MIYLKIKKKRFFFLPISLGIDSSSFSSKSNSRSFLKLPIWEGNFFKRFVLNTKISKFTNLSISAGSSLSSLLEIFNSVKDVHVPKSKYFYNVLMRKKSVFNILKVKEELRKGDF